MKRFFITMSLVFVALIGFAQDIPAGMRVEIASAEQDKEVFEIFKYKDDEGTVGYYLSVGKVFKILEIFRDADALNSSFDHINESCIWLGATSEEAAATLDSIIALYDEDVQTTREFEGRASTGSEKLGKPNTITCVVQKKLLGGKRLQFIFTSGKHTANTYLNKSTAKQLRWSMKFNKKLHPND